MMSSAILREVGTVRRVIEKVANYFGYRSFEAASTSRRWSKAGSIANPNSAILAAATPTARRTAYLARNNPWCARATASLVANTIGCGIIPRSKHPNPKVREALRKLWSAWERHVGFYAAQALLMRLMVESGEAFAVMGTEAPDDVPPGVVPLSLTLVDREQVPVDRSLEFGGGTRVRAGIEIDARGRIVAYHILPTRMDDPFIALTGYAPVRVPAADVLHLFQPVAAGQLRGMSWFAPVLLRLHELDQFEDAALVRAKTQTLFCGIMTSTETDSLGYVPDSEFVMEPGTVLKLPLGASMQFSEPSESKDYGAFVKAHLRSIAAGIGPGLLYEMVANDLEGVTYSSIRQGLIEHRRALEQLQHLTIIPQSCDPVWRRFVLLAVLNGLLVASDFGENAEDYFAVEWHPPGWDWVDPEADVKAELLAIGGGLKSRAQSVAARGEDIEEIDRQIAADTNAPAPQPLPGTAAQ